MYLDSGGRNCNHDYTHYYEDKQGWKPLFFFFYKRLGSGLVLVPSKRFRIFLTLGMTKDKGSVLCTKKFQVFLFLGITEDKMLRVLSSSSFTSELLLTGDTSSHFDAEIKGLGFFAVPVLLGSRF